jgi:Type I phosphodiesterase / nucleotide pyrophosphatase
MLVAVLGAAAILALTLRSADPPLSVAAESDGPLRVYVVVVDGMKPSEVGLLTPTLNELKENGTWYEQARAIFPAETLPNHVAMATGVLPTRNGIIGNQAWRPNPTADREYMEHPGFIEADTIVTRLERACDTAGGVSTATVMSKSYLYGAFRGEPAQSHVRDNASNGGVTGDLIKEPSAADDPNPQREADFHWHPRDGFRGTGAGYVNNPSDHALDEVTMDTFLGWIREQPKELPQFAFVNLGNVDRAGHADAAGGLSSGASAPFRQSAVEDTDGQLRLLLEELRGSGAWDDTVLILLSDHAMDYAPPENGVNMTGPLQDAGYTAGKDQNGDFWTVGGGGSGLVWVNSEHNIAPMARILAAEEGVDFVATRKPVPGGLGGVPNFTHKELGFDHPNAPDIQIFVKKNYRVDDTNHQNPLPGNHGHAVTEHAMLMVTGGHPMLRDNPVSIQGTEDIDNPANGSFAPPAGGPGNLSIAPTVAALYGIGAPAGGYDGPLLGEAFDSGALPNALCGTASGGGGGGSGGDGGSGGSGGGGGEQGGGQPGAGQAGPELTTTIKARKGTVRHGERVQLSGVVKSAVAGDCEGPYRVALYERVLGSRAPRPRVLATSRRVGAGGRWSMTVRPTRNAEYLAKALPTPKCASGGPAAVRVLVRVRILLKRTCGPGRTLSGGVVPRQSGEVLLRRLVGGRYRTIGRARLDRNSRFRLSVPSCAGTYQVVWRRQGIQNESGSQAFRP